VASLSPVADVNRGPTAHTLYQSIAAGDSVVIKRVTRPVKRFKPGH